jgi:predicted DNA-binding protein (MmcQ/YjbR family)
MLQEIRNYCLKLKGTTEDIKWEDHLCFCVGEKMYLVTAPDAVPVSASFKASDEDFEELITREGIIPAPYMARHKWVHVDNIERFSFEELSSYSQKSYELVKSKLPKKLQKEIEG